MITHTGSVGPFMVSITQPEQATPAPRMRVGLTCQLDDYTSHLAGPFSGAAFNRIFYGPGEGYPRWDHHEFTKLPADVTPWVSFKDTPTGAGLAPFLGGADRPVFVTYYHERDNAKVAAEQSKAARASHFARWRDLMALLDAHPNRRNITAMPAQTLQWTAAKSTATAIKGDGDWRTWWAGVGDGIGWDAYVDSWATNYPDPEAFLRIPLEAAAGVGRPLWLPELGSVRLAGDTSGAGRAAWIRDIIALLRERGCAGVAWWCAPGSNNRDFHLSDEPSAQAWREAILSQ